MIRAGDLPVRAEFLDDAAIAALIERRRRAFLPGQEQGLAETGTLLLWTLGEARYATPLADVREVAPVPRVTRVPGAPPALLGVISWRGIVHNLLDPGAALGSASGGVEAGGRILVMRDERVRIALNVSTVPGVVAVSADDGEATPADQGLTRFIATDDGNGFALVSTPLLIERLLARRGPREG